MELKLSKRPKSPVVIQGFPGFGMVGAIAVEYLVQHLKTKKIGTVLYDTMPAMVAIHGGKVIEPFSIYYDEKNNIVLIHSILTSPGSEWVAAQAVAKVVSDLNAKEVICLEGIGSDKKSKDAKVLSYSNVESIQKKLNKLGYETLSDGIVLGVTASVIMSLGKKPLSCLFAEAHANLPDSNAAAKLIEALDKYLNLKVDYKPLTMMAEQFESKLKEILQQGKQAEVIRDKKTMSYVG